MPKKIVFNEPKKSSLFFLAMENNAKNPSMLIVVKKVLKWIKPITPSTSPANQNFFLNIKKNKIAKNPKPTVSATYETNLLRITGANARKKTIKACWFFTKYFSENFMQKNKKTAKNTKDKIFQTIIGLEKNTIDPKAKNKSTRGGYK